MSSPVVPTVIADRLEVVGRLHDRGLGESWHCRDPHRANGPVMVKLLRPVSGALPPALDDLLLRTKLVRHEHALRVYSHGLWRERPYVVQEFVEGPSLGDELDRARAASTLIPVAQLRAISEALVAAVDAAHRAPKPVLHLGVDPSCVILGRASGAALKVKLLDFGLAHWADADPEAPTRSARSFRCAPPEVFGGEVKPTSDVFALGALLREALALPPKQTQTLVPATVERRRQDVPEAVWAVLTQSTEIDPARRQPSIRAFGEALRAAWEQPLHRPPAPTPAPAPAVEPTVTPAPAVSAATDVAIPVFPQPTPISDETVPDAWQGARTIPMSMADLPVPPSVPTPPLPDETPTVTKLDRAAGEAVKAIAPAAAPPEPAATTRSADWRNPWETSLIQAVAPPAAAKSPAPVDEPVVLPTHSRAPWVVGALVVLAALAVAAFFRLHSH